MDEESKSPNMEEIAPTLVAYCMVRNKNEEERSIMSYQRVLKTVIVVVVVLVIIAVAVTVFEAVCIEKTIYMNMWK